MAKFEVRHLRIRKGRCFFQPSKSMRLAGFLPQALGSDEVEAARIVKALNDEWDRLQQERAQARQTGRSDPAGKTPPAPRGTIEWLIQEHKKADAWKRRPPKTKKEFDYYTGLMVETRKQHAAAIQRPHVRQLVQNMRNQGFSQDKANRVVKWLRFLLSEAMEHGLRKDNPAFALRLSKPPPRQVVWSEEEVWTFVAKAIELGRASIALAVLIAYDMGQRRGDVIAMTWGQWDGERLLVQQSKTQSLVSVRALPELRDAIEVTKDADGVYRMTNDPQLRDERAMVISEETGRPYKGDNFSHLFREIADAAGFKSKQFIDLRRSSVVRLSLAGCTPQLISAITGHSIETVARILRVYNPTTKEQSDLAITMLQAWRESRKLER
jgi:integrase